MTQPPTRQELEAFLNCPEAQDDLLSVRMARELLRLMGESEWRDTPAAPRALDDQMKMSFRAVKNEYRQAIGKAQRKAADWLRDEMNIEVGGYVERKNGAVYLVTRLSFDAIPLWMYGRKIRKDGSLGDHDHPIGDPEDVRAVEHKGHIRQLAGIPQPSTERKEV